MSLMEKGTDFTGVTISFLCHDGQGNFLMNKRGQNARDEHGNWDNGGGSLDFGSNPEETLKKEILEEYGTEIRAYEFLGYRDVHRELNGKPTHWISLDFLVLVEPSTVKNGEPHKFDEIGWFTLNTLPSPVHTQFPRFLENYREKISETLRLNDRELP